MAVVAAPFLCASVRFLVKEVVPHLHSLVVMYIKET